MLLIVGPTVTKKFAVRIPIPAAARLAMTLRFVLVIYINHKFFFHYNTAISFDHESCNCRYLATGDCITSTTYTYLVSLSSAINIIRETSEVIWSLLVKDVMQGKLVKEDWLNIAAQFEELWQFPHCIGAIDGKHVTIQVC